MESAINKLIEVTNNLKMKEEIIPFMKRFITSFYSEIDELKILIENENVIRWFYGNKATITFDISEIINSKKKFENVLFIYKCTFDSTSDEPEEATYGIVIFDGEKIVDVYTSPEYFLNSNQSSDIFNCSDDDEVSYFHSDKDNLPLIIGEEVYNHFVYLILKEEKLLLKNSILKIY